MNKHIKIIQENGSYVGYLLTAGEITFRTNPCGDPGTASKLVSEYINQQTTVAPVPVSTPPPHNIPHVYSTSAPAAASMVAPKSKGCGCKRG